MSSRKPVCQRFLNGDCRAPNCKYFHPVNATTAKKEKKHNKPNQHNNKPNQHNNKPNQHHKNNNCFVEPVQEKPTVSEILYKRALEMDARIERENARLARMTSMTNSQQNTYSATGSSTVNNQTTHIDNSANDADVPVSPMIENQMPKPGTFGAKLLVANATKKEDTKFDKNKFESWLKNEMPDIDGISIIKLYSMLLKKNEAEAIEYASKSNTVIPDIMAMLKNSVTNKKWIKELYCRFLGDSYTGSNTFTMKNIKGLLTFSLVQIYLKTVCNEPCDYIEYIVCMYVCIMRLISKFGFLLEIDDFDTIEQNYNAKVYNMFSVN